MSHSMFQKPQRRRHVCFETIRIIKCIKEMAEKNDNDNRSSQKDTAVNSNDEDKNINSLEDFDFGFQCQNSEQIFNGSSVNQHESTPKKEENPFSFKKFLNQDVNQLKNQNVRRKKYSPENLQPHAESSSSEKASLSSNSISGASKIINTNEMASVLPDFVQDHLVVEQCYLNGVSSKINMDNLILQNFPDLNLEHRQPIFNVKSSAHSNVSNHHSLNIGSNLPDFTLSAGHYPTESEENFCNKGLPDFTVNTSDRVSGTLDKVDDEFYLLNKRDGVIRRKIIQGNCGMSENSPSHRNRVEISLSPTVPLDLPSYDGAEFLPVSSGNLDQSIPFDLTIAADDRNGSNRGIPSTETVSKSLPDFLSDGPIQNDRLGENLQHGNLVTPLLNNENQRILSSEGASNRLDEDEHQREIELLRWQLSDKNRRIHILESEIEDLQSTERNDARGLEYALVQAERSLKQSVVSQLGKERASNAEAALMKLQQENSQLRMELAFLRSKNSNMQSDDSIDNTSSNVRSKSQRIAKELRVAANSAENSLRSLLTGIDNLRMIAASVESIHVCKEKTEEEVEDIDYEHSASGPAL